MKVALAIHHHSPGYGGPYTAISETAYYLYKKNLNINLKDEIVNKTLVQNNN